MTFVPNIVPLQLRMIDIFIAYSHEDLAFKNELKKFLRPMLREEHISLWDDFDIEAGKDWNAEIKERLYGADIVLLLVSSDSLASDYFYGKEVAISLERHNREETIVVPVILRHCDWKPTPLGDLEALPEKGRPVVEWPTRDQAFQDVVSRLRRVVEELQQKRKTEAAQTEALRHFRAASEAADHLFQKKNWAEARTAYTSALAAHLPGFVPDRQALQARQADCDAQIQAEKNAVEQQQRDEKAKRAQEQRAQEAAARQAEKKQRNNEPDASSGNTRLLMGIGIVVVFMALMLWWQPWKSGGRKQELKTPVDTEAADFAVAKASNNLPTLRNFIQKKYPQEQFENEAKKLVQSLERKVDTLLNDAAQFQNDPDERATVCNLIQQALDIAPGDARAVKAKAASKCK